MHAVRDGIATARPGPATALTELAGDAMSNFISAQQVILNLVHEQNRIVLTGIKERVPAPVGAMADLFRRSVDAFIEMEHSFLTIAEKQSEAWTESAKHGKTYVPKVSEIVREGLDNFVGAQKKFLDVVAEEADNLTKGNENGHKTKKTALTELAQEGADAFIEAQKKLLSLVGEQFTIDLKAGGRIVDMAPALPTSALANLTRDTVETFVAAQKSLLDVVTKPQHVATAARVHKPAPAAHRATRKVGRKANSVSETAHEAATARAN